MWFGSFMLDKIHPNLKLLIIGVYIGWVGSIATILANLIILYLPIITHPPQPILNVFCIAVTFVFQELIRKSALKRRIKLIIFAITASLAGLAYLAVFAWAFRWFSWL